MKLRSGTHGFAYILVAQVFVQTTQRSRGIERSKTTRGAIHDLENVRLQAPPHNAIHATPSFPPCELTVLMHTHAPEAELTGRLPKIAGNVPMPGGNALYVLEGHTLAVSRA